MSIYYTWLIEYERPEDAPAAHKGMKALGGEVAAVQFSDALTELCALRHKVEVLRGKAEAYDREREQRMRMASEKPHRWCEDCAHFRKAAAPAPDSYNPCTRGHDMLFWMPECASDLEWCYFKPRRADREERKDDRPQEGE